MIQQQKYIKTNKDEIIIFPMSISHDVFKSMDIVSAGFCHIISPEEKVQCFGYSMSLNMDSDEEKDTQLATRQVFGISAMVELMRKDKE